MGTSTGIPLNEAVGLPFWKIAPPGMLQQLQTAYRLLRENVTDSFHQMMVLTDSEGENTWLECDYLRFDQRCPRFWDDHRRDNDRYQPFQAG